MFTILLSQSIDVKVIVYITPKKNLLDPQGSAVKKAMESIGYSTDGEVRMGKTIEFTISPFSPEAEARPQEFLKELDNICRNFLCNPVIEEYRFVVESD